MYFLPEIIRPKGLSLDRQWYLRDKICFVKMTVKIQNHQIHPPGTSVMDS